MRKVLTDKKGNPTNTTTPRVNIPCSTIKGMAGVPSRVRDNASLLVRRLHATPVQLHPSLVQEALESIKGCGDGGRQRCGSHYQVAEHRLSSSAAAVQKTGLHSTDVLVVGRDPSDAFHSGGASRWCYAVAAQHALAGGRVTYVIAPASPPFNLRVFTECIENALRAAQIKEEGGGQQQQVDPTATGIVGAVSAQQNAIVAALDRVDVISCVDMEDLFVFCTHYHMTTTEPPPLESGACNPQRNVEGSDGSFTAFSSTDAASSASGVADAVVPLLVVEGAGGRGSYLHQYERAAGQEVPLREWLLAFQRRTRCALVLVEELGSTPSGPGGFAAVAPPATSASTASDSCSSAAAVSAVKLEKSASNVLCGVKRAREKDDDGDADEEEEMIPVQELLPVDSELLRRLIQPDTFASGPSTTTMVGATPSVWYRSHGAPLPTSFRFGARSRSTFPDTALPASVPIPAAIAGLNIYYLFVITEWQPSTTRHCSAQTSFTTLAPCDPTEHHKQLPPWMSSSASFVNAAAAAAAAHTGVQCKVISTASFYQLVPREGGDMSAFTRHYWSSTAGMKGMPVHFAGRMLCRCTL